VRCVSCVFFGIFKLAWPCEISDVPLVVRPSPIHSVGVYTTTPIRKGTRVVEYTGPRITPEEADRRYDGLSRTYLYGLEDGKTVIDGEGLGAYLNHSCDPNCEVDEIKGRVWLFALRDIAAGEELVWDYNLYDDEAPAPCHCGSPRCRGTMYSPEWMAKMRRREARRGKRQSTEPGTNTASGGAQGASDVPAPSRARAIPR
jgi:hypothetical protein